MNIDYIWYLKYNIIPHILSLLTLIYLYICKPYREYPGQTQNSNMLLWLTFQFIKKMSPLWDRNKYMGSQMKISDYRDESENRFRSLQVYLQTFNLMIAMLIEMFPEG